MNCFTCINYVVHNIMINSSCKNNRYQSNYMNYSMQKWIYRVVRGIKSKLCKMIVIIEVLLYIANIFLGGQDMLFFLTVMMSQLFPTCLKNSGGCVGGYRNGLLVGRSPFAGLSRIWPYISVANKDKILKFKICLIHKKRIKKKYCFALG